MSGARPGRAGARRGTVMVVAVVVLVVLQLAVVTAILGGAREQDLTVRRLDAARALYAAEAGLNVALREIALQADESGDGAIGSIGGGSLAAGLQISTARVAAESTISGAEHRVVVTAESGGARRHIEAMVRRPAGNGAGAFPGLYAEWYDLGASHASLASVPWHAGPTHAGPVPDLYFPAAPQGARALGGAPTNWAVRFTGRITIPASGAWTFATTSDDNSILKINGTTVVHNDFQQGMTRRSGTITLTAGAHDLEVQWMQGSGQHGLIVEWQGPGVPSLTSIPWTAFTHPEPMATTSSSSLRMDGWALASRPANFAAINFNAPPSASVALSRINMPSASVARWPGGPTTNFAARITGSITIPTSGVWELGLTSDDGSRLIFNGTTIVNMDRHQSMTYGGATVNVAAGTYPIEVQWYQGSGSNGLIMSWRAPGGPLEPVPSSAFAVPGSQELLPVYAQLAVNDQIGIPGVHSSNAAFIDGFDALNGPYGGSNRNLPVRVATNATLPAQWTMAGRATVYGDARVGPGGCPDSVIVLAGQSSITGTRSAAPVRSLIVGAFPPPTMPASSGMVTYSGPATINSNRRFTSLTVLGQGTVLTIDGDVTIQVDHDVTIMERAEIQVNPGSRLRMYVGGSFTMLLRAKLNTRTGLPDACWIFHTADLGRDLTLDDDSVAVAHIRSARGVLTAASTANPGHFHGTFRGRGVMLSGTYQAHLDVSVPGGASGGGGAGSRMTVLSVSDGP
jgi:hypothetical protein